MWPRLNVWVMTPASACRIDDRPDWVAFVADAHSSGFSWKGIDYSAGIQASAPGHVEFEIPPGTYIVWAERLERGKAESTHKAVVAVDRDPLVTVRLLPEPPPIERPSHPPGLGKGRRTGSELGKVRPNTPPVSTIDSPADGITVTAGKVDHTTGALFAEVSLRGHAVDAEDGNLTGDALAWFDNIDGGKDIYVGAGNSFPARLETGDRSQGAIHKITLRATDSRGATGQTSVTVTVNPYIPK